MAILPHTFQVPGGQPCTIYGETANINYFIGGDLEPDTIDGPTNNQVQVSGGQRRQYPGDATRIGFAASEREFLKDPSRSSGAALPGRAFRLMEGFEGTPGELRQFTYKGRFIDLHAFISSEASMDLRLYNASGAKYKIPEAV